MKVNEKKSEPNVELTKGIDSPDLEEFNENLRKNLEVLLPIITNVASKLGLFLSSFFAELKPIGLAFVFFMQRWSEARKANAIFMAENGWFPSWVSFYAGIEKEKKSLDSYMIASLDEHWAEIVQTFSELYPHRKTILQTAFDLHKQGNYIASVPLLIIQADGICHEHFSPYFAKGRENKNDAKIAPVKIIDQVESGELILDFLAEMLLEPLKLKPQLTQPSSRHKDSDKEKGPNRHGIIHGSRNHLDYGTKLNSYKAISFIVFVVTLAHKELREQLFTRKFSHIKTNAS